jgi:pyridoxal phosphate enzyme (YggS family)
MAGAVAERVHEVQERIAAAAIRAGRRPGAVRLVAVTKGVVADVAVEAVRAGVTDLGESKAQELIAKAPALSGGPAWHFLGRIQRNKVASAAPLVSLWQSVDRSEVGVEIARRCPGAAVLVQVNTSSEPQKGGCRPVDAARLRDELIGLGLDVRGLMTVPTAGADPRGEFAGLAALADRLGLAELSMGMTDDFELAIAEGATIVRVGRGLFGPRISTAHLQR